MTLALIIISLAAIDALVASGYQVVHTLQLEGYRTERYLRHGWENRSLVSAAHVWIALGTLVLGLALAGLRVPYADVVLAVLAITETFVFALRIWLRPRKKPIVLTARVYRIITAMTLLVLAVVAIKIWGIRLFGFAETPASAALSYYALFAALTLLMPFVGVAAICALGPIEARGRRKFVEQARARLARVSPIVVGVAGSYGKTTTKAALAAVLGAKYRVLATPESYNTLLGVTRTINEQLTDDVEVFIVEMGARHEGDIDEICQLVKPKYGVITRLGPQHLEYFKTPETIVRAKTELARSLPADGVAIVDADGYSDFSAPDWTARTVRVSADPGRGAEIGVGDVAVSGAGTTFTLTRASDGERLEMTTKLLGRHAAFNSGLAVVAGLELGIDPIAIRAGLSRLAPVDHRLQIVRSDTVTIIDDAFSSNPEGFAAALEVLGSFPGRRILITPGMIELGDQTISAHIAAAKQAAESCDIAIVVGRAAPPEFAQTLRDAGFGETKLFVVASLAEATEVLGHLLAAGDVVLFENDLPDNFE